MNTLDYQKGKIYKIISNMGPKIYIGSTIKHLLSQRMAKHRSEYNFWKKNNERTKIRSYELFDEYGVENCEIILLELCPCNSKDELTSRESHYIRTLDCVNKNMPGRIKQETDKIYREANKDTILKKKKEYYEANKEEISEKQKQPFNCDCGSECTSSHKSRHFRTKKHLDFIASKSQ